MEGPSIRSAPRIPLDQPIELRAGKKTIRLKKPVGNLSAGGLFVKAKGLPVSTRVRVRIRGPRLFEAEGVVRETHAGGLGIEFIAISDANRKRLDDLIAALTKKEVLAS